MTQEAQGYIREYRVDFPDWVNDVCVSYDPLKRARDTANARLGIERGVGEIQRQYNARCRDSFYEVISQTRYQLPDVIQFHSPQRRRTYACSPDDRFGIFASDYNLFYVLKTDEVLRVEEDAENLVKFLPNSPEFIGWEELRNLPEEFLCDVELVKLTHELNQDGSESELSVDDMMVIIGQARLVLANDLEKMRYLDHFYEQEKRSRKQAETVRKEEEELLGFEIRRRTLNLVNTLSQNPRLFRRIPKVIPAGKKEEKDEQGVLVESEEQPFFIVKQFGHIRGNELLLVPSKITRSWWRREKKEPDFSQAIVAGPDDWINAKSIEGVLLSSISRRYREFIENPEG